MVAEPSVEPTRADPRPLLVCNCRLSLVRAETGETFTVKTRAWDCPSCGLDKRRKIAEMCADAGLLRMLTLTFRQPIAVSGVIPDGFLACDRRTHVARNPRDGVYRWRILGACPHCCRRVSAAVAAFRKRLRRRFGPQVKYLWAREDHPTSGALHLHVATSGLPVVTRRNAAGRWIKRQWAELGGGFVDLGLDGKVGAGGKAGWYLGKYLAKRHDQRLARGYRRWSRTQNFAPWVRMVDPQPTTPPGTPLEREGWLHPLTDDVLPVRTWNLPPPDPAPAATAASSPAPTLV